MECRRKSSTEELEDGKCEVLLRAFSSNELLKATNNFHRRNIITEDGCYRLYKGSWEKCPILVKKFEQVGSVWSHEDIRLLAANDMAITSKVCNHRNILKLIGCCLEHQFPILVYECEKSIQTLSNGLYGRVRSSDHNSALATETRLSISNDIASALVHLHTAFSTPIVHRNLKPANIIIDQNGVAKLMDFSLAIQIPPGESQVEDRVVGTNGFAEPEYVYTGIVTVKTDVYAFGMIMLELLTGKSTVDASRGGTRLDDLVKRYARKRQLNRVVDPRMMRDGMGVDHKQSHGFLELALRCVEERREDKPDMLGVAAELGRICSPIGWGDFRVKENKMRSVFTSLFGWLKRYKG